MLSEIWRERRLTVWCTTLPHLITFKPNNTVKRLITDDIIGYGIFQLIVKNNVIKEINTDVIREQHLALG